MKIRFLFLMCCYWLGYAAASEGAASIEAKPIGMEDFLMEGYRPLLKQYRRKAGSGAIEVEWVSVKKGIKSISHPLKNPRLFKDILKVYGDLEGWLLLLQDEKCGNGFALGAPFLRTLYQFRQKMDVLYQKRDMTQFNLCFQIFPSEYSLPLKVATLCFEGGLFWSASKIIAQGRLPWMLSSLLGSRLCLFPVQGKVIPRVRAVKGYGLGYLHYLYSMCRRDQPAQRRWKQTLASLPYRPSWLDLGHFFVDMSLIILFFGAFEDREKGWLEADWQLLKGHMVFDKKFFAAYLLGRVMEISMSGYEDYGEEQERKRVIGPMLDALQGQENRLQKYEGWRYVRCVLKRDGIEVVFPMLQKEGIIVPSSCQQMIGDYLGPKRVGEVAMNPSLGVAADGNDRLDKYTQKRPLGYLYLFFISVSLAVTYAFKLLLLRGESSENCYELPLL